MMANLVELVEEWNKTHDELAHNVDLDHLTPEAYETKIAYTALSVIDEAGHGINWALVAELLKHPNCRGGWMKGNAVEFAEKKHAATLAD